MRKAFLLALIVLKVTCADNPIYNRDMAPTRFNNVRTEFAKNSSISNMYEMAWDDGLLKQIESLPNGSCSDLETLGFRYLIVKMRRQQSKEKAKDLAQKTGLSAVDDFTYVFIETHKDKLLAALDSYNLPTYFQLEKYHPLQTKFACSRNFTCKYAQEMARGLCLFGPEKSYTNAQVKRGTPGSGCPHGMKQNLFCKEGPNGSNSAQPGAQPGGQPAASTPASATSRISIIFAIFVAVVFWIR